MSESWHPRELIRPGRRILGMSAVLLPFHRDEVDWRRFQILLDRTLRARLRPAVNMDTGYADLIDDDTRRQVLRLAADSAGPGGFVAGAFVGDGPGDPYAPDRYAAAVAEIAELGGTPVIFPSHGLSSLPGPEVVTAHAELSRHCEQFIAFELGTQFAPFGRIHDLDTYAGLMEIPQCLGAKHSSLDRGLEWQRLRLRDRVRPDFHVFTGNDLAIDMVMYGSDYLLGLSAFAPDVFARRDFAWEISHPEFYEINDALQFLGDFAFRDPVPAYKHTAAQFLHLRGWIRSPDPHPRALRRPDHDVEVLRTIATRLDLHDHADPVAPGPKTAATDR